MIFQRQKILLSVEDLQNALIQEHSESSFSSVFSFVWFVNEPSFGVDSIQLNDEPKRLLLLYLPLPASWAEAKERAKLGYFSNFNWFSHILIQPSFP